MRVYEIDKLFNLRSNEFPNEEMEKRDSKKTGWPPITSVKRNNFFTV